jgi:hypothetical protein
VIKWDRIFKNSRPEQAEKIISTLPLRKSGKNTPDKAYQRFYQKMSMPP